jgi:membrane protease YdiL (CAAX protease family)
VIHGSISAAVVAMVAGFIFCMLYERTSSIFATIIVHAINNLLAFSMICYGLDNVSFYEVVGGGTTYYITYAVAFVAFVLLSIEAYFAVFKRKK